MLRSGACLASVVGCALLGAACAAPPPLALELPGGDRARTHFVGLFSDGALIGGSVVDGASNELPSWSEDAIDAVEIVSVAALPDGLQLIDASLLLRASTPEDSTLGELLDALPPTRDVEVSTWSPPARTLSTSSGRAVSPELRGAFVQARRVCPMLIRRTLSPTTAVDLVDAVVVEQGRATLLGVEPGSGRTRFGFASAQSVWWVSAWDQPAHALARGMGVKSWALVDQGGGRYGALELDYNARPRPPAVPLGVFSEAPRVTELVDDRLLVYAPDRVVELDISLARLEDRTRSWPRPPVRIALTPGPRRGSAVAFTLDDAGHVWRRADDVWTDEGPAVAPGVDDRGLAASARVAWAWDGARFAQRSGADARWRADDPVDTEAPRSLALADESFAVAVLGDDLFVHDGLRWCPVARGLPHRHELLSGSPSAVIGRVREPSADVSWIPVWLTR